MSTLYIQFSDDGQHIRKWSHLPFPGAGAYRIGDTPPAAIEIEQAARSVARVLGYDFDEQCGHETDVGACDSPTCIGAMSEDHDPAECRAELRKVARAALGAPPWPNAETEQPLCQPVPELVYLMDLGDGEISWCGDPDPAGENDVAVEYTRSGMWRKPAEEIEA